MKSIQKISLIFIALTLVTNPARADDPIIKLSRGLTNVVTSPGEYLIQYKVIRSEHNFIESVFATVLSGTIHMVGRVGLGVYEIGTFLIPIPAGYEPPYKPATVLDALQEIDGKV